MNDKFANKSLVFIVQYKALNFRQMATDAKAMLDDVYYYPKVCNLPVIMVSCVDAVYHNTHSLLEKTKPGQAKNQQMEAVIKMRRANIARCEKILTLGSNKYNPLVSRMLLCLLHLIFATEAISQFYEEHNSLVKSQMIVGSNALHSEK